MGLKLVDIRICKRCCGNGSLFRPLKEKTINFKKCTDCNGRGTKHRFVPDTSIHPTTHTGE